jgi:hypothetical protein
MKKYTETELKQNYDKFIAIIKKYFTGERLEKLLFMYSEDELGGNLMIAPASGNKFYHNAYDGGYIGKIDFTDEELIFTALHHDLGKLGTKEELHYIPNDSKWHVENRGDLYKMNDKNSYMTLTDRTFFTLNHYGISYNEKEYFGIKLTDGLFDDENIKYYKTFDISKNLKYKIQYIMHWADYMSTIIERQDAIDSSNSDKVSLSFGKF